MRILFLYEGYDEYTVQLWNNIRNKNPHARMSLLTTKGSEEKYKARIDLRDGEQIYTELDRWAWFPISSLFAIRSMPHFDIIHITYMELKWGILASTLKRKCDKLIISVGGGDLYESSVKLRKRIILSRLVRRANLISSENTQTRKKFSEIYKIQSRNTEHRIVRYGVNVIDAINCHNGDNIVSVKKKWGIPTDRIIVMLGHNGFRQHQHLKMIEAVGKMESDVLDRCFFVIPMTYGVSSGEYKNEVKDAISQLTDKYVILEKFLNVDQMAEITMMTDIMIHIQTSDQLSSTMMAHLYNGNVVLAGSWLPYDDIKKAGIRIFDIDSVYELTEKLKDAVKRLDEYKSLCTRNRDAVYCFSSWEACVDSWMDMYDTVINEK